jgi:hypothetical protein
MPPRIAPIAASGPHPPVDDAIFRLSPEEIQEFQALIHRTSGVWIAPELAAARANALLVLTRILIGPLPEEAASREVRTSLGFRDSAETR